MSSRKVSSQKLREERDAGRGDQLLNKAKRVSSADKRGFMNKRDGRLLFLLPILLIPPLLGALTGGSALAALSAFAGIITLFLGAMSVREGTKRGSINEASIRGLIAGTPYKTLGAGLYGLGFALFSAATLSYGGIAMGLVYGILASGAVVMRYGLDEKPNRSRAAQLAKVHGLDLKSVIKHLDEGEERIDNMRKAITKLPGTETKRKVGRVADLAEQVLEIIEHDPRDVRNARRFLISYLPRAEEVITEFGDHPELLHQPEMVSRFGSVIADLTQVFEDQTKKLEADDTLDLEVKLEVLSQRLRNEGAG